MEKTLKIIEYADGTFALVRCYEVFGWRLFEEYMSALTRDWYRYMKPERFQSMDSAKKAVQSYLKNQRRKQQGATERRTYTVRISPDAP